MKESVARARDVSTFADLNTSMISCYLITFGACLSYARFMPFQMGFLQGFRAKIDNYSA